MTNSKPIALIPTRQSLDMVAAVGGLLDAALHGAMLAPGNGHDVAGAVQLRDDQTDRQAIALLRAAQRRIARKSPDVRPEDDPGEDDGLSLTQVQRDEEGVTIGIGDAEGLARDMARELLAAFIPALREMDATNYLEFPATDPDTRERYAVIVVKPGARTPHELRRDAEDEVDRLRELLAAHGIDPGGTQ